jgi:cytochrome c oxidase assembly protein subunit 15
MVATGVGFLTLVLAIWTARSEPRRGLRSLAWGALGAVIAQGVLGGLTVIYLLPTPVSVAHACLAQAFFCIVIALAFATSREWREATRPRPDARNLLGAAVILTAAVFAQLLLGAIMRHTGAGLAIPDFPRALGNWIPPLDQGPVALHFAHRVGALVVLTLAVRAWLRAVGTRLQAHAAGVVGLVVLQGTLGAITVLTAKAPVPTSLHVATGAAILGLSWLLALRAHRTLARPEPAVASPQALPSGSR